MILISTDFFKKNHEKVMLAVGKRGSTMLERRNAGLRHKNRSAACCGDVLMIFKAVCVLLSLLVLHFAGLKKMKTNSWCI